MGRDPHDFEEFMRQRDEAARAFVSGDAAPISRIVARDSPATFFGPMGGTVQGAEEVSSTYARDSSHFLSGDSSFEILHMAAGDTIAYWVGFQRATARLDGRTEDIPFNLRVTEVFRREDGAWKLIHRHADSLVAAPEKKGE
jgi:ketosteroid isomerase-like protein